LTNSSGTTIDRIAAIKPAGYAKGTDRNVNTTTKYYRINRREISFLRFIFEAYDGLAVISTVDSKQGIISVTTAPGCQQETDTIIQGLKEEIMIEKVDFFPPEGYELAL